MQEQIFELQYAIDTFYFLICGALVMWMAAGFAMLEAGLVRTKSTTEILTKNRISDQEIGHNSCKNWSTGTKMELDL